MPLERTATDFDETAPPNILFWMEVKDAAPPKRVRCIVTNRALEEIDNQQMYDQFGRRELFEKHRASIEAKASDKFDRGEVEDNEGVSLVRVASDDRLA